MLTALRPETFSQPHAALAAVQMEAHGDLGARALEVLRCNLEFMYSDDFEQDDAEESIGPADAILARYRPRPGRKQEPRGVELTSALIRLCETPLLAADDEQALFRRMNYVRYLVSRRREWLDPQQVDVPLLVELESLLAEGEEIRNCLLSANIRLVISIAKKFASPVNPFDELVSEGMMSLLRAIEKFDYRRGFRLSTYATHAIRRSLYRAVVQRHEEQQRISGDEPESLIDRCDDRETVSRSLARYDRLKSAFEQMLGSLDRRERGIIRARFALGREGKVQTLQSLSEKMGVCKERVRQLEKRAIAKLRALALDLGLGELEI